jgi:ribonuclease HI
MEKRLHIYTDGASRGNPGRAAIAFLILDERGKTLKAYSRAIGIATNNEAEYRAVIKALETATGMAREVALTSDSEVVVSQLSGRYKVKAANLRQLFARAKSLENKFSMVRYSHVRRSNPFISKADSMVNHALDRE